MARKDRLTKKYQINSIVFSGFDSKGHLLKGKQVVFYDGLTDCGIKQNYGLQERKLVE